jgi:hypothetical protein
MERSVSVATGLRDAALGRIRNLEKEISRQMVVKSTLYGFVNTVGGSSVMA